MPWPYGSSGSYGARASRCRLRMPVVFRRCSRLVAARLRLCGLPELVEPMKLLTSELVTNALEHGDGPVSLLLSCSSETVRLTVDDGSRESPRLEAPELDAESGRGLWIVESIASEYGGSWGVSPDCTKTWCSLTVPAAKEPAVR